MTAIRFGCSRKLNTARSTYTPKGVDNVVQRYSRLCRKKAVSWVKQTWFTRFEWRMMSSRLSEREALILILLLSIGLWAAIWAIVLAAQAVLFLATSELSGCWRI